MLVDDDVYLRLCEYKRVVTAAGYAIMHKRALHAHVMGEKPDGFDCIDHISRDRLDNRRANLRWVTYATNVRNRSTTAATGFVGVVQVSSFCYEAYYYNNDFIIVRQYFSSLEEAVVWRDNELRQCHPEDYE